MSNIKKRLPTLQGKFYPSDTTILQKLIDDSLSNYNDIIYDKPFTVISPADDYDKALSFYTYSYAQLKSRDYDSVILLSGVHKKAFPWIALSDYDFFTSPLGDLELDKKACDFLCNFREELIKIDNEHHDTEHAIELQLPFLSTLFKNNIKIIPIIIGESNTKITLTLAKAFKALFEQQPKKYLIITCTNLSDKLPYDEAVIHDKRFVDYLLEFNADYFSEQLAMRQIIADGGAGVTTAMRLGEMLDKKNVRLLELKNTGDYTDDKYKVSGYISAIII